MERTKGRPLVTGVLTPTAATLFALFLEVTAFLILWLTVNLLSSPLTVWPRLLRRRLHDVAEARSTRNIVIGGAAGAVPVPVWLDHGSRPVSSARFFMFGFIFLWTPPHFWALAVRYATTTPGPTSLLPSVIKMPGVTRQMPPLLVGPVHALITVGPRCAPQVVPHLYLAALLGIGFVGQALALRRDPSSTQAMKLFGYSIVYLGTLFGLSIGSRCDHPPSVKPGPVWSKRSVEARLSDRRRCRRACPAVDGGRPLSDDLSVGVTIGAAAGCTAAAFAVPTPASPPRLTGLPLRTFVGAPERSRSCRLTAHQVSPVESTERLPPRSRREC